MLKKNQWNFARDTRTCMHITCDLICWTNFWSEKKILAKKKFGVQKFWVCKKIWVKNFFGSTRNRPPNPLFYMYLYFLTIQVIKACQTYDFIEDKTISQAWLPLFTGYKENNNISLFVAVIQKSCQIWYATFPILGLSTLVIPNKFGALPCINIFRQHAASINGFVCLFVCMLHQN